jgi:mono/diheme cytochrome c family protein
MHVTAAARVLVLSAFLAPGSGRAVQATSPSSTVDGSTLARELGCAGCHAGVGSADLVRSRTPALGPQAPPLPAAFVFSYLEDPQRRRGDIGASRMPDFRLDEGERLALALLLGAADGDPAVAEARSRHPNVDAEAGRRIFGALGCAGCHGGVAGAEGVEAPDLSREGARARPAWLRDYLTAPMPVRGDGHPDLRGARMPDFRLAPDEADALATYLQGLGRSFAGLEETPLTSFETRRTQRLLEGRLARMGCHRIGERGGEIGPSLDGVSLRREPAYVLEMVLDPRRAAPGAPMPHQPLRPREASRVARYLLSLPGAGAGPARISLTDPDHPAWTPRLTSADPGEALYARHCAACHGTGGRGDGWNASNLPVPPVAHADAALMGRRPDDTLYDGIFAGAWVLDGSPRMPAFGALLSPGQIRSLVAYIRTLCSCQGPAWSGDRGTGRRGVR